MLVSFDALAQQFAGYTDVKGKIRREVQGGRLVQVARGLYETDARTDGKYLAGAIYGPSYLSFDYALSVHALIPEAVYGTYTSATFRKGKTKRTQKSALRPRPAFYRAAAKPHDERRRRKNGAQNERPLRTQQILRERSAECERRAEDCQYPHRRAGSSVSPSR